MMEYQLEKTVWTEADFEVMSWHDATLYGIAAISERFELLVDLDYLCEWICPVPPARNLSFRVAPATLVFSDVFDLEINVDRGPYMNLTIHAIERSEPRSWPNGAGTSWTWKIELHQGEITFTASGYQQFIRRVPRLVEGQHLTFEERGGLSFDRAFKG